MEIIKNFSLVAFRSSLKLGMKFKIQNLQPLKGMHDILPQEQVWWDKVRKEAEYVASQYHFMRIDTPLLERAEVFEKALGSTSDIVEKQMFVFKSSSGDRYVLRPEGTAGIVRAYIQHGLSHLGQPLKLFQIGPMFRKEQPQAGRFRQFHQLGFEILGGDDDPVYDAQVILALSQFLERVKIKKTRLHINSVGCRVCRPNYRKKLIDYYKDIALKLCGDCRRRLKENPLRLLDCKNEECQEYKNEAPILLNYLCSACNKHFKSLLEFLEELKLPYDLDNYLVRGLDYYNRTAFEFYADSVGQDGPASPSTSGASRGGQKFNFALAGGGRYDYLLEMFGKRQGAGTGGAAGLERVIEVMKATNVSLGVRYKTKVFFIHIGAAAKKKSLALIEELRSAGILVMESLGKDSLGAQLRAADKESAEFALIFGQKEVFEESIIIRDLKNSVQETVPLKKLVNEIKKRLK